MFIIQSDQIRPDQSLSRVWLFATPWIATRQASLSITNSRSSLRLTSIKSVMPSSHLILNYFGAPTVQIDQRKVLQNGFCVLATSCPSLFESLSSELMMYFRLILYLPWPGTGIRHFSGKPGFPSKENGARHPALHSRCAHCFWAANAVHPFRRQRYGGIYKSTHNIQTYAHIPI